MTLTIGSDPKNSLVHCPDPVTFFVIHAVPAPYRTVLVPLTENDWYSLATALQVVLAAAVDDVVLVVAVEDVDVAG
jgi:hypothetical protein